MSTETEQRLAEALRRAVGEPAGSSLELSHLAEGARVRARRLRHRARLTGAGVAAALVLAVGVPIALSAGNGPGSPAPAGTDSPTPTQTASCSGTSCEPAAVAAAIRKPLRLPGLAAGAACPSQKQPGRRFPAGAGFSEPFDASGTGPLYVGAGIVQLQRSTGGWWTQKMIWVFGPEYAGPVLLRGGRVDGPGQLRFDRYLGAAAYGHGDHGRYRQLLYVRSGLQVPASGSLDSYPGDIFVTKPGCYAIQVDGVGFSEHLYLETSPSAG